MDSGGVEGVEGCRGAGVQGCRGAGQGRLSARLPRLERLDGDGRRSALRAGELGFGFGLGWGLGSGSGLGLPPGE